jgi:hypothetical protein
MRTHRFGRKIKLPATIAIKHQVRMRMAQYEVTKAEAEKCIQEPRTTAHDFLIGDNPPKLGFQRSHEVSV